MAEKFEKKIGQPKYPETAAEPQPKREIMRRISEIQRATRGKFGLFLSASAAAVCVSLTGEKEANANPVTWKIGTPFGKNINKVVCTVKETGSGASGVNFAHGNQPNKVLMTFIKEKLIDPDTCDSEQAAHQAWFEVDDGPNEAVVIRQLGKAQEIPGLSIHIPYCIDGQQYDVTTAYDDNGDFKIFVNGKSAWEPYPYLDGMESMTTIDYVTRSKDPLKLQIVAAPFFPNNDWFNYDSCGATWNVNVSEPNYYDAIQKAIDKAWAQGKNPYEAGPANPLDLAPGVIQASPETDKLFATTRWGGFGDYDTYTYFFSNQYKPLERSEEGVWTLEKDGSVNEGLGEPDFVMYGGDYANDNGPEAAIDAITPEGKKVHLFITPGLRAIVPQEQPDSTYTEPEIIMEEDFSADTSGESVLCVTSTPVPGPDAGPEQVEQPNTAEEGSAAVAEEPIVVEQPVVAEPVTAEPMPDVFSGKPDSDTGTESVVVPQPEPQVETAAEPAPDAAQGSDTSQDAPQDSAGDMQPQPDSVADVAPNPETSMPDSAVLPDTQPDSLPPTEIPDPQDTADAANTDVPVQGEDAGKGTLQGKPDTTNSDATQQIFPDSQNPQLQPEGSKSGSSGCSCAIDNPDNTFPAATLSGAAAVAAWLFRQRRRVEKILHMVK